MQRDTWRGVVLAVPDSVEESADEGISLQKHLGVYALYIYIFIYIDREREKELKLILNHDLLGFF